MTKLMFALWTADHAALRDAGLHADLAARGVGQLQVNLDDADVAPALRLSSAAPISAIVSTWSRPYADPAAIAAVLRGTCSALAGWRVEERRRLDPPETPDGVRADALANVVLIRRPPELARDEWLRRWMVDHTPVAIRTQASFGYLQNIVLEPVTPDAPPVSGLAEELFPSAGMRDQHEFYGSGGDKRELDRRFTELMASVARFGAERDVDLVPSSRYTYELADVSAG